VAGVALADLHAGGQAGGGFPGACGDARVELDERRGHPRGIVALRQHAEQIAAVAGAGAEHPERPGALVQLAPDVALHGAQAPGQAGGGIVVGAMPLHVVPQLGHGASI